MDPFAINAVAVEWEFRCHGKQAARQPWKWRCRSKDGLLVSTSEGSFSSLREAVADASNHGFCGSARNENATVF